MLATPRRWPAQGTESSPLSVPRGSANPSAQVPQLVALLMGPSPLFFLKQCIYESKCYKKISLQSSLKLIYKKVLNVTKHLKEEVFT